MASSNDWASTRIRAIVVDDADGIGARLEREVAASKAAYRDPWREALEPFTANQFASVLPAGAGTPS